MNSKEELWQGYDEQAQPTRPITAEESAAGELHGAAHLWVWRRRQGVLEVLLQQRHLDCRTWPGYWDMAAAGHIDAGEEPLAAALRESREEIGLTVESSDIKLMFVQRVNLDYKPTGIREHEIQWVYAAEFPAGANLSLRKDEVMAIRWITLPELSAVIDGKNTDGPTMNMCIVPHGTAYFAAVFKEIGLLGS